MQELNQKIPGKDQLTGEIGLQHAAACQEKIHFVLYLSYLPEIAEMMSSLVVRQRSSAFYSSLLLQVDGFIAAILEV